MQTLYTLLTTLLLASIINQPASATVVRDETSWPIPSSEAPSIRSNIPVEKRPIFVFAFVHDDVPEDKIPSLYPDHFAPVIKELRSTTGRNVSVIFVRNTPPFTNYPYKGENQAAYDGWRKLGAEYRDANNLPLGRTTKFMLLTKDGMNHLTEGIAGSGQQFALAALNHKQTVGHELGHLLDAQHELSDVRYNGWWCETFMTPKVNPYLSNCYVFTDPNRERINSFLRLAP